MRFFSLVSALLGGAAQAVYLNSELSFGYDGKVSLDNQNINNFHLQGTPSAPEILSNKVILTPPILRGQRGAVWSTNKLLHSQWGAEVDFRATGPERGGGNLQIWYANEGKDKVGSASIYTVGKFDGLVLVVDQHAGSAGTIRGFLNDGTTDYKSHHSVDSLAFGHCFYPYRNLGRPSQIKIRQTTDNFRVDIDDKLCFDSSKIKLPLNYNFGVSAASAEIPDAFEIYKFVITTDSDSPDIQNPKADILQPVKKSERESGPPTEQPASAIQDQTAQFADLHDRLQAVATQISSLKSELSSASQASSAFHQAALARISGSESILSSSLSRLATTDTLINLEKKIDKIGEDVRQTKAELHNSLDKHVAGLKKGITDGSEGLGAVIKAGSTGWFGLVVVVLGSQVITVIGYWIYKTKKNSGRVRPMHSAPFSTKDHPHTLNTIVRRGLPSTGVCNESNEGHISETVPCRPGRPGDDFLARLRGAKHGYSIVGYQAGPVCFTACIKQKADLVIFDPAHQSLTINMSMGPTRQGVCGHSTMANMPPSFVEPSVDFADPERI